MREFIVATLLVLVALCSVQGAENLIPKVSGQGFELQFNGVEVTTFGVREETPLARNENLDNEIHFYIDFKTPIKGLTFFSETAFTQSELKNVNALRYAELRYEVSKDWKIAVGRVWTPPLYNLPSVATLETIKFARDPFGIYGYGIRAEGNLGKGWSLMASVTGKSDYFYNSQDSFDRAEGSIRVSKEINKKLSTFFVGQVSQDLSTKKVGWALEYHPTEKLTLKSLVFSSEDTVEGKTSSVRGGYATAAWKVNKYTELHSQLDILVQQGSKSCRMTNGLTLFAQKHLDFTIDEQHDWKTGVRSEDTVFLRMRIKF